MISSFGTDCKMALLLLTQTFTPSYW